MSDKPGNSKIISPIEYIVMLIVGQSFTFDKAFKTVDSLHFNQFGKKMDRKAAGRAVLHKLNLEVEDKK